MAQQEGIVLGPRDWSDLVGDTFVIYARNFLPFVSIVFWSQIPLMFSTATSARLLQGLLISASLYLSILANGATIYAVARQLLGRRSNVLECYRRTLQKSRPLFAALFIFTLAITPLVILSFIIVGIPLLLLVLIGWYFWIQAVLVEEKTPAKALARSWELIRGSWWRILGIGTAFVLVIVGLLVVTSAPGILISRLSPAIGNAILNSAGILVAPVAYIGATLVYFDLRVRKEKYSLVTMATEIRM